MSSHSAVVIAVVAGATLAAGCATVVTRDEVVGRYQKDKCFLEVEGGTPCRETIPTVSVSVITIAAPGGGAVAPTEPAPPGVPAGPAPASTASASGPSSPPTGLSLSDRGQAAYLQLLADPKKAKSMAALRKSFAAPIQTDTPEGPQDLTVFHRTMIVTVARDKNLFNPADRLEDVDVVIKPDNAVIQSWDLAATQYSTINAGSIALTGTRNLNLGASLGTPATAPVSASLTGAYSQGQSRVESLNTTQQAENLTISLKGNDTYQIDPANPNELHIHRQGGIGVDLTGNIILKIDVALPTKPSGSRPLKIEPRHVFTVEGDYFDKKGAPSKTSALTLKPHLMLVAKSMSSESSAIVGTVDLIYTLRHVMSGDATLEEGDDSVVETTPRAKSAPIVLIPESEVTPRLYSIQKYSGLDKDRNPILKQTMVQRMDSPGVEPLCFKSVDDANDLVTYFQHAKARHPERIGRDRVGFSTLDPDGGLQMLSPGDIDSLYAYGDCKG